MGKVLVISHDKMTATALPKRVQKLFPNIKIEGQHWPAGGGKTAAIAESDVSAALSVPDDTVDIVFLEANLYAPSSENPSFSSGFFTTHSNIYFVGFTGTDACRTNLDNATSANGNVYTPCINKGECPEEVAQSYAAWRGSLAAAQT